LLAATNHRLLTPDALLEAGDLTRRIEGRDALERDLDLLLRLCHLCPADELVALLDKLLALRPQLVQPVLELLGELGLLHGLGLQRRRLTLVGELAAEGDLRQLVETVGL